MPLLRKGCAADSEPTRPEENPGFAAEAAGGPRSLLGKARHAQENQNSPVPGLQRTSWQAAEILLEMRQETAARGIPERTAEMTYVCATVKAILAFVSPYAIST